MSNHLACYAGEMEDDLYSNDLTHYLKGGGGGGGGGEGGGCSLEVSSCMFVSQPSGPDAVQKVS